MGTYDVQQVCLNGHQITVRYASHPEHRRNFCPTCGAETIHACPKCNSTIPGKYDVPGVRSLRQVPIPSHCEHCGGAFPWTERKAAERAAAAEKADDPLPLIERVCTRFHLVVRQLHSRHDNRPTLEVNDEYDVQDLLHALLRLHFDDIRSEEWTPSYAGGCARMDFLLKGESLVIEVKMTRKGLGAKEIGDQLIIDIERYQAHPACKTLVCFVYDPVGRVANPAGLERDLSCTEDDLTVEVIIVPKGH